MEGKIKWEDTYQFSAPPVITRRGERPGDFAWRSPPGDLHPGIDAATASIIGAHVIAGGGLIAFVNLCLACKNMGWLLRGSWADIDVGADLVPRLFAHYTVPKRAPVDVTDRVKLVLRSLATARAVGIGTAESRPGLLEPCRYLTFGPSLLYRTQMYEGRWMLAGKPYTETFHNYRLAGGMPQLEVLHVTISAAWRQSIIELIRGLVDRHPRLREIRLRADFDSEARADIDSWREGAAMAACRLTTVGINNSTAFWTLAVLYDLSGVTSLTVDVSLQHGFAELMAAACPNLTDLRCAGVNFTGVTTAFPALAKLRVDLSEFDVDGGTRLAELAPNLTELRAHGVPPVLIPLLAGLSRLPRLRVLGLRVVYPSGHDHDGLLADFAAALPRAIAGADMALSDLRIRAWRESETAVFDLTPIFSAGCRSATTIARLKLCDVVATISESAVAAATALVTLVAHRCRGPAVGRLVRVPRHITAEYDLTDNEWWVTSNVTTLRLDGADYVMTDHDDLEVPVGGIWSGNPSVISAEFSKFGPVGRFIAMFCSAGVRIPTVRTTFSPAAGLLTADVYYRGRVHPIQPPPNVREHLRAAISAIFHAMDAANPTRVKFRIVVTLRPEAL